MKDAGILAVEDRPTPRGVHQTSLCAFRQVQHPLGNPVYVVVGDVVSELSDFGPPVYVSVQVPGIVRYEGAGVSHGAAGGHGHHKSGEHMVWVR